MGGPISQTVKKGEREMLTGALIAAGWLLLVAVVVVGVGLTIIILKKP